VAIDADVRQELEAFKRRESGGRGLFRLLGG
jgi:hypothetical protein